MTEKKEDVNADRFNRFQRARHEAEKDVREYLRAWVLMEAPADLRIGEFRVLSDGLVKKLNSSMRTAFDVGEGQVLYSLKETEEE